MGADFDGTGRWLAVGNADDTSLWALEGPRPHVLKGDDTEGHVHCVAFTPNGRTIVAAGRSVVRAWSLGQHDAEPSRVLLRAALGIPGLAIDPSGQQVAVAGAGGRMVIVPLAGGEPRELKGFSEKADLGSAVFAEGGRLVAAAPLASPRDESLIRVWDLATGAQRTFGPLPGNGEGLSLRGDGREHLVAGVTEHGLVRFDLRTGSSERLPPGPDTLLASSPGGRSLLACRLELTKGECLPMRLDLDAARPRLLATHGKFTSAAAFDPSGGLIATGDADGAVRIGPADGGEPHVFLGHVGFVRDVAFSPDGRWLASAGQDGSVRIWPVPDVTKTPLHKRPHAELMTALRSHTNLRAVPDPKPSTGYKLEHGPFPGWAKPPEW
jgi:WD40 repeat protein